MANRPLFDGSKTHPAAAKAIADNHSETIREAEAAISSNKVVILGMAQNPFPRRARKLLDAKGVAYHYLSYGSYFSEWRKRTALKMWSGWPTFPMIFIDGVLIGGAEDLERLDANGELAKLLPAK
jgi:monothiol glutaredoxin